MGVWRGVLTTTKVAKQEDGEVAKQHSGLSCGARRVPPSYHVHQATHTHTPSAPCPPAGRAPSLADIHHALRGMRLAEFGRLPLLLREGRLGLAARVLAPLVEDVHHALRGVRLSEFGRLP